MDKENLIQTSHKKKEILSCATTWIDLEGIKLSEISQIRTNIIQFHSHVESKKQKPQAKQKDSDTENKVVDCQSEQGW